MSNCRVPGLCRVNAVCSNSAPATSKTAGVLEKAARYARHQIAASKERMNADSNISFSSTMRRMDTAPPLTIGHAADRRGPGRLDFFGWTLEEFSIDARDGRDEEPWQRWLGLASNDDVWQHLAELPDGILKAVEEFVAARLRLTALRQR